MLFGRNPAEDGVRALLGVAGLVEEPTFYPYLSGRANLEHLAALDGVGLTARQRDKVGGYSHGMRQCLGIAAAFLRAPRLLVLDEPTTGLDPAGMRDMRELIGNLGRAWVGIYALMPQAQSLEELFLDMTETASPAARIGTAEVAA
jgi:ABC-2 type transport system ATP-binding protein